MAEPSAIDLILTNFLNAEIFLYIWPMLWAGLKVTLLLSLVIVPLGFCLGLALAVLYSFRIGRINWAIVAFVDFFRSIPPLALLVFVFYGLPFFGGDIPAFLACTIAFTLNSSSYYGEIFRAGIESIGKGQMEAARSTGLSRLQATIFVIVPQAIRNVLPDLISNSIELIKATSIASVVALPELLAQARFAQNITYNATPLIAAAAIYLALLWPLVRFLSRLERGMMSSR